MTALAINGVTLRHGKSDVLKDVSLTVPPGKVAALLGPASSGKTALLRAVAGLESPHAGSIRIGDEPLCDAGAGIEIAPERRGVGFMFQSGALWPHWSVRDNLIFSAQCRGGDATEIKVNRMIEQFGLSAIADHKPVQLSAEDRQRIALVRALAGEPKLLLLDEPLSGRDRDSHADQRMWLRQTIAATGLTTLLATRERADALALADHVILINAGAIEQEGAPADLYAKPATPFVAGFMGACTRIEGTLVEKAGARAFLDVMGTRIGGVNCTKAGLGDVCTGVIRIERVLIGGGPGLNRLAMKLAAQTYLGERWEIAFVRDALTVRAHVNAPLRHELYHIEFPPDALWIY